MNIPPCLGDRQCFSPPEVEETRRIAKLRTHVERAIGRIKNYHILDGVFPIYNLSASCLCTEHTSLTSIICNRICKKGPLRGNVNIWVRDKTCAKPPIHAIADYCIIGRYCVSPIFRPCLKPVRLSCISNEAQIVSLCRVLWPCTELTGNDNTGKTRL